MGIPVRMRWRRPRGRNRGRKDTRELHVHRHGHRHGRRRSLPCASQGDGNELDDRLVEAWEAGKKLGKSEDAMVAEALGRRNAAAMSDLEVKYREKIKTAITDKVDAAKRRDAAWAKRINKGRKEYARGNYGAAAREFSALLSDGTAADRGFRNRAVGGEVVTWLGIALDASGDASAARNLYRELEASHPITDIRKRAKWLLSISDAPKLTIRDDERVKIPDLADVEDSYGTRSRRRSQQRPAKPKRASARKGKKLEPTWEEKFLARSPVARTFRNNKYVRVAFTVLCLAVSVYSSYIVRH